MKKNYKFVSQDLIKLLTKFRLGNTKTKNIHLNICIGVIDTIFHSDRTKTDFGFITYQKDFTDNINASSPTIQNHIKWLMSENIIIRSIKEQTHTITRVQKGATIYKYSPYQYNIHPNVEISSFQLFVYETYNSINLKKKKNDLYCKLKNTPNLDDDVKLLLDAQSKMTIDINEALTTLHTLNNKDKFRMAKNVYMLALKQYKVTRGLNVNRVYNNLTTQPSKLHKHLYLDGYKVSEIDARSSQLALISLLTRHIDSDLHSIIENSSKTNNVYTEIIKYLHLNYEFIDVIRTIKGKTIKMVIDVTDIQIKDDIKGDVYASIFSGFSNETTISKVMKKLFGNVIDYLLNKVGTRIVFIEKYVNYIDGFKFQMLKTKEISNLARYLQNLEAKIWLKTAVKLIKKGILAVSKHDSIIVQTKHLKTAVKAIKDEYNYNGFNITDKNLNIFDGGINEFKFIQPEVKVIYIRDDLIQQNTNLTKMTFFNKKTGETFIGIISDFRKKYSLDKTGVRRLSNGSRKSFKNWIKI